MTKHLSLNDRILIEKYLDDDLTFAFISRRLGRSLSTVSREVRNHRAYTGDYDRLSPNGCSGYRSCLKRNLCSTENYYTCQNRCKFCQEYDCKTLCDKFDPAFCAALEAPPYVCNGCPKEKECKKIHAYYSAGSADRKYRETLSSSRQGIHTPMEDLERIDAIVAPLIRKGQSINHIFASHREEIGLCEKTLYNYIDLNVFSFRNIDLPKKVRYRIRHPQKVATKLEYEYRKGRTIDCFRAYVEENPSLDIVEMDTVKGARGSGKNVLLTFIFRKTNFMLIFLLPDGSKQSVRNAFDFLSDGLGTAVFRRLFPIILTDNGVEFKGPHDLEFGENGARRTHVFYCDPQASWQKPHVEKNHTLIRRILPKGTSFSFLTDGDVSLITRHINSVPRESFDNRTPFDLMTSPEQKKLLEFLKLSPIPLDDVLLKPALLKRKK
jgi:IS30 family transposase